jgi:hypothetical protein
MFSRQLILAICFCQICLCLTEGTISLVPTPTSTKSQVVLNATAKKIENITNNTVTATPNKASIPNVVANNNTKKIIYSSAVKSNIMTAKEKVNLNRTLIVNATTKTIVNATTKTILNASAKVNVTKNANLSKLDEIVKKIDTSVDEINKTTRNSSAMITVIIVAISLYGIYKIVTTIKKIQEKKRQRAEEDRLVLPGTPSASSPKNSLHRSASSGFFATQEQTIRSKSPENSNLRQRFSTNAEPNKWHV